MKYIFFILSICFVQITVAQNVQLDSLNAKLKRTTSDTGRVNIMNAIANKLTENDLDSAIKYSKKSYY